MGKYCDNEKLEQVWTKWLFATDTKDLDVLRESGVFYTRFTKTGTEHVVGVMQPYHFCLEGQFVNKTDVVEAFKASMRPRGSFDIAEWSHKYPFEKLHRSKSYGQFFLEEPTNNYWDQLLSMIYSICHGLSLKFRPKSDDERSELVQDAFGVVLSKLQRGKLKFTPGKAPAFNLLTTTIYRVMCSIKNKSKGQRERRSKLAEDVYHGSNLPNLRSLIVAESSAFTDGKQNYTQ